MSAFFISAWCVSGTKLYLDLENGQTRFINGNIYDSKLKNGSGITVTDDEVIYFDEYGDLRYQERNHLDFQIRMEETRDHPYYIEICKW